MLIFPPAYKLVSGGGGDTPDGTRRKLVSTSAAAGTGMRSAAGISLAGNNFTLAFWWRPTDNSATNEYNMLWSDQGENTRLFTGGGGTTNRQNFQGEYNEQYSTVTGQVTPLNSWHHIVAHFGLNFSGTKDFEIYIDGASSRSLTGATTAADLTTSQIHYLFGQTGAGGATVDGCIGEVFDFCLLDGIVAVAELNYDAGSWRNLTATGLSALKYRLDGQSTTNAGLDSSGNGHNFTVEGGGVTTSASGLPTGA